MNSFIMHRAFAGIDLLLYQMCRGIKVSNFDHIGTRISLANFTDQLHSYQQSYHRSISIHLQLFNKQDLQPTLDTSGLSIIYQIL